MKQLIIFVVLCLPLLYSCGVPQQQETDTAYKTLTIKSGDQILKTGYTATLRGRQNVEIRPQVSGIITEICINCLLYTSPSPRDRQKSRMPSSA